MPHPNFHKEEDIMLKNLFLGSIAIVAGLFLAGSVMAIVGNTSQESAPVTINVSATAVVTCQLSSVPSLGFGDYTGDVDLVIDQTITVMCNSQAPFFIEMEQGAGWDGSSRTVTQGTDFLTYTIETDATSAGLFRDQTDSSPCAGEWISPGGCIGKGSGILGVGQNFGLTGTVVQSQAITALGDYTDTVDVTLKF